MQGYDLDDTLASVNLAQAAVKPMEAIFAGAPVIYTPKSDFVVITGRPHRTSAQTRATSQWLRDNQPNFKAIYYVEPGNPTHMAEVKARIIKRLNLTDYTDNNADVLKALAALNTGARLWKMNQGGDKKPYTP